jgi:RNA polymerase sigma-70 factor (ECF subfamily)
MAVSAYAALSDADLLCATRADPEAFAELYDRYEDPLLAFFLRATHSPELAADLTAEVFAGCRGRLTGRVTFVRTNGLSSLPPPLGDGPLVGRFSVTVP